MSKKYNAIRKNLNRVNAGVSETADYELKNLSIIIGVIIGIICIFYIITVVVTKNNNSLKYSKGDNVVSISYTDILASDILKKDGSYYVLIKDSEDVYSNLYTEYLSSYETKDESLSVYYVDLNDALNQDYKATENNLSASSLKFKGTVLLKIADGKIESSYDNKEAINDHLKSLVINK